VKKPLQPYRRTVTNPAVGHDGHTVIAAAGDADEIVAELTGSGLGTLTSSQLTHPGQANSNVTYS
jgi:hypothetical protein